MAQSFGGATHMKLFGLLGSRHLAAEAETSHRGESCDLDEHLIFW